MEELDDTFCEELETPYAENIYDVETFITNTRESIRCHLNKISYMSKRVMLEKLEQFSKLPPLEGPEKIITEKIISQLKMLIRHIELTDLTTSKMQQMNNIRPASRNSTCTNNDCLPMDIESVVSTPENDFVRTVVENVTESGENYHKNLDKPQLNLLLEGTCGSVREFLNEIKSRVLEKEQQILNERMRIKNATTTCRLTNYNFFKDSPPNRLEECPIEQKAISLSQQTFLDMIGTYYENKIEDETLNTSSQNLHFSPDNAFQPLPDWEKYLHKYSCK